MNETQRRFYTRLLVDSRVVINDTRLDVVDTTTGARMYIVVELSHIRTPPYVNLGVFEVGAAGNRLIHYSYSIDALGVSRSDVLAYLAEQLSAWKLKAFHDILDVSTSSSGGSS